MREFVFVLELTLGHSAHARNLARVLLQERHIRTSVIEVPYHPPTGIQRLPGLRSWSLRASGTAREALRRRLRKGPIDALFIHTQVLALLSHRLMQRVPTVISLDATPRNFDLVGQRYGHRRQHRLIEEAKRLVHRRAFSVARELVTWSHWAADSLVSDYGVSPEKIQVIRPGVDLHRFQPSERTLDRTPVRMLFVGGDFARKGGEDLLRAMSRLTHRVELDVVTGCQVDGVPAGISCRIHRGLTPHSDALVDLYRGADLFVLPTLGDCLPVAIAEAMACGLPVVASRVGAIHEMVRVGENGFLVSPGEPGQLRRALETLIEQPALRRTMGRRSRLMAEQEHDADRNNRLILDLMTDVSERPGKEWAWNSAPLG